MASIASGQSHTDCDVATHVMSWLNPLDYG
jgi:hypothetical protein